MNAQKRFSGVLGDGKKETESSKSNFPITINDLHMNIPVSHINRTNSFIFPFSSAIDLPKQNKEKQEEQKPVFTSDKQQISEEDITRNQGDFLVKQSKHFIEKQREQLAKTRFDWHIVHNSRCEERTSLLFRQFEGDPISFRNVGMFFVLCGLYI
jgi:hypothetical protein